MGMNEGQDALTTLKAKVLLWENKEKTLEFE